MGRRIVIASIVCAVFAAGLGLRLRGIDFLLPHHPDPDSQIVAQAARMRAGVETHDYVWSTYPHLLARVLSVCPEAAPAAAPRELSAALAAAARPFLNARILVALLGALALPLTYAIARRFAAQGTALLAAALLATSLIHANFSQQARPHVAFGTLALAVVWTALRLYERASLGRTLAFAGALFCALGTLHFALFLLPVGPVALLCRRDRSARKRAVDWIAPALAAAAAGWLFWPFLFERVPATQWSEGLSYRFPHQIEAEWASGFGFQRYPQLLLHNEPVLALAAALGLLCCAWPQARARLRERRAEIAIALAYALPFALAIGIFQRAYARFLVSLLPYLAILGAVGIAGCAALVARRAPARVAAALQVFAALGALAFPAHIVWRLGTLRAAPDTLELAAEALARVETDGPLRVAFHPSALLPVAMELDAGFAAIVRADVEPNPWAQALIAGSVAGSDAVVGQLAQSGGRFPLAMRPQRERDGGALCRHLLALDPEVLVVPPMDNPERASVLTDVLTGNVTGMQFELPRERPRREHKHGDRWRDRRGGDCADGGPRGPESGPAPERAPKPRTQSPDAPQPPKPYPVQRVRRHAVPPRPPPFAPAQSRSYQDDEFLAVVRSVEIWGPPVWIHYFPEAFSGFLLRSEAPAAAPQSR
ncbi:MAG: hypothetical protein EPO68_10195 [Planctomycetota bacterium]|nr:MAG: hypothetical protein EPO68_10195 [Planctomycetota bacterium]